ncbi:Rpn family recombination-promoting nuclease/putative transposase [Olivibacter sp. SDN3]|uniref:Rpn family recombination-promoting nuclease/putative transposase n=1 Tax=Olivibacter sp. SDN3 TaxID=2764720 RepID=UPI001650E732|nr:Rpn family recombination-promoting nuclease/putative transposase [Olivibacter sp. SDN3]QNL49778.1 Rpn family recombination-promoting nuclease/putative transposase [Olivibacter sp. SDN3]
MPNNRDKQNKQTNQYDKIFRENMETVLPGIVEHLLKLNIVSSEELPDDVQHTKERKPDLLKKVTDTNGETYVLHIEYQAKNDKDMIFRMAEYSIMLQRRYHISVKQYVIFIGAAKPNMAVNLATEDLQFRYNLVSLSTIDYKIFLQSDKPEEKILAILANFVDDSPVEAITMILQEIRSVAGGDLTESRYFNQLRVLVQLRKLEHQFDEAMETITKFFKEEKDPLFRRGEAKGEAKGELKERTTIAREMKKDGIPVDQIAKFTKLSLKEIEKL